MHKVIKSIIVLVSPIFSVTAVYGQDYSVFSIPPGLLNENANAVVRYDSSSFEIHDAGSATVYRKYAVTLLNKKADEYAEFSLNYDEAQKVKSIDGYLYDKSGERVKKLKNRDIHDYSAVSSISIYDDDRIKYAEMPYPDYPYTVVFEYEKEIKDLLFYPVWDPVSDEHVSVQYSIQNIICPENFEFRYKEKNLDEGVEVHSDGQHDIYTWKLKNFKALEEEPFSPELSKYTPIVYTAPNKFIMEDYEGNANSWQSIGNWVLQLNKNRDELPEQLKNEVRSLTADLPDSKSKVKALYQYLQNNTRYVSIQLGIGGWQPFTASYVYENGYGDCKALSNYMYALLKEAGIPSLYTLVRAGENASPIDPEFPIRQFNHAFLCVPNDGDTIWLECTSQDIPFGYLGSFTDDRNVLLITENGGVLTHTPIYKKEDNLQLRNANVILEADGSATAKVNTRYKGLQFQNVRYALRLNEKEQKKKLYERIDIPSFDIIDFKYDHTYEQYPEFKENLELFMRRYASVSGKRIFFKPNLMNKQFKLDKLVQPRKYELEINKSSIDVDTVTFQLPDNYHPEYMPEDISLQSEFGKYSAKFISRQGRLMYIRKMEFDKGIYPPEKYEAFVDFCNKIAENDNIKLVLVKST